MGTTNAPLREGPGEAQGPAADLSSLLESLSERLHERNAQERWYPGSAAGIDAAALPYYRLPDVANMEEVLEAALVRPAGVRLDFEDWLASFEHQRQLARTLEQEQRKEWERELRRQFARARHEDRAVATHQRIALAGGIACATTAVGMLLTVLAVRSNPVRPNVFVALAIALGGVALITVVGMAIRERRWNAAV